MLLSILLNSEQIENNQDKISKSANIFQGCVLDQSSIISDIDKKRKTINNVRNMAHKDLVLPSFSQENCLGSSRCSGKCDFFYYFP